MANESRWWKARKDMVSQTWILHYFEFADFAGVIQRQNRPVGKSYKSFLV